MITLYTTPSCSSCKKAKKWLDDHGAEYIEKNIFSYQITDEDLELILQHAENGFDDIISTRSNVFKEKNLDIEDMSVNSLKTFIKENSSVLKRPILVDERRMQIGFNEEEIRFFIPKPLRAHIISCNIYENDEKRYKMMLEEYFNHPNESKW